MIRVWSPTPQLIAVDAFLAQVDAMEQEGVAPFDSARLELIGEVSRRILADPMARTQPQFVALGYWMRRSALSRMKIEWLERHASQDEVLVSRGVALHLPPTNVDTIFVYSWVLSFLAGNTNIVRLPSERSEAVEWLISVIIAAVYEAGMGQQHLFCAFDHTGDILADISRRCDLRLIWGGDAKVDAVSRLPLRPDGLSIGFPDRTSATMIASAAYLAGDSSSRDALAVALFNDVFWFDQMGCGSPRVVFWVDPEGREGMADLAERLSQVISQRGYVGEPATAIAKMVAVYGMLADGKVHRSEHYSNALDIAYADIQDGQGSTKQGGGFLTSVTVGDVADIATWVRRDMQTITHYGFDHAELLRLAENIGSQGGYRLVPIGQALMFDETWDGIPLITHMTRRIVVRV